VFKLPHANAGCIAIAADTETFVPVVNEHCTSRHGRHAPMQAIEAKGAVQEIRWTLTGTANTAKFNDLFRDNIQFETSRCNLARNRIMPTPLAQCRGVASVIGFFKTH
jgi:hypothetical protein